MIELLYYCRSGYEADLLAEIDAGFASLGQYGYAKFTKNSAYLRYSLPQLSIPKDFQSTAFAQSIRPNLEDLIFARQKLIVLGDLPLDADDRISQILNFLQPMSLPVFSDVIVEYPDSEEGKQIAKFCKKFVVPLRNALRSKELLLKKPSKSKAFLHLLFETSGQCTLAISLAKDRSHQPLGINRLKMPSAAPSRSTLKLEEAFSTFFNPVQLNLLFSAGMRAVDLGACPGGWTYQLVNRKLTVEAVDHGKVDEQLMATGLVEYYSQDGFLYKPQQGNVDWLVCDMIEQPTRVSELMLNWLETGKANAAIFNLKLPMSKRHKVVAPILQNLNEVLKERFGKIIIKCKHLYHNRDEVTVLIIVNSQALANYKGNAL